MSKNLQATLYLVIGIGLFSTIEISQKMIVQQCGAPIDPYIMVFARFIVTGVLLLAMGLPMLLKRGVQLGWRDLWIFTINGLLGITICLSLFHYAIDQFRNASSAAVVFSANAVYTVIFARFINKEPWTLPKWIAILLGLGGASMFAFENGAPSPDTYKAIGLMSLAALLFALSVCFTKKTIRKYGPMVYMGGTSLVGAILSLPTFFMLSDKTFMEAVRPMGNAFWSLAYFILVATAFAYVMYYRGIAMSTAFHASMMFMLKPVLACIFAQLAVLTGIIASESRMNLVTVCGTAMIVFAMVITQLCQIKAARQAK